MTALPLPYTPGSTPWASDKQTARIRGFAAHYLGIEQLPLPDQVADTLAAFTRAVEWAEQPRPDADAARHEYRRQLLDAAVGDTAPPDVAPVITALARADASTAVARDTATVTEELHMTLMGAVLSNLDEMVTSLVGEHDQLMAAARSEAARLPASVRSADAAVAAGPDTAAAWLALSDIGARLMRVRDTRLRAAGLDGTRNGPDYALHRYPERFPKDDTAPSSDALRVLDLIVDRHRTEPWCPTRAELVDHVEQRAAAAAATRRGPESRTGRYGPPPIWDTAS